jgi:hypothetical protein
MTRPDQFELMQAAFDILSQDLALALRQAALAKALAAQRDLEIRVLNARLEEQKQVEESIQDITPEESAQEKAKK